MRDLSLDETRASLMITSASSFIRKSFTFIRHLEDVIVVEGPPPLNARQLTFFSY